MSAGLGILGTATAYLMTMRDPVWYFAFVPRELAGGRTPRASAADLAKTLASGHDTGLSFFASFLFTHNAQIALFAFALGFACCLPTAFLLFYNGLMLGAFLALFVSHGLGVDAGGWLMIHGVTELLAVTLAGAAGLKIGRAIAFPGARTRLEAASEAGKEAAMLMVGLWAGLTLPRFAWTPPAAFLAFMLAGFGWGQSGGSLPMAEAMIAASLVALGLALCLALRAPVVVAAAFDAASAPSLERPP